MIFAVQKFQMHAYVQKLIVIDNRSLQRTEGVLVWCQTGDPRKR
jgi:hypothetical protein